MYIFGDSIGESLVCIQFWVSFPLVCIPPFAFIFSMPLRKKVMRILAGLGENQRAEPSVNHISMLFGGTESSSETSQPENKNIVAAIESL